VIRKNSLIGINATLIAPIEIPEETFLGAGSIVSRKNFKDVPPHSLVVALRTIVQVKPGVCWKIGDSWILCREAPDPALMEHIRRILEQKFAGDRKALSQWLTRFGVEGKPLVDLLREDPMRAAGIIERVLFERDLVL
jgi:carbonic anhydrase/acetyltransferase-like protein (isoleucine patch superfamily)